MASQRKERRRRYFLKTGLQFRYLRIILVAVMAPAVLLGSCLYYLFFYLMAEQLGIPESIAYNITPVLNKINLVILLGLPIVCVAILAWGLVISHRIAGPIYRLEKDLEKICSGEYALRIKLRRKDEFEGIARGINKILDKLEAKK